jgi:hypothetical protein
MRNSRQRQYQQKKYTQRRKQGRKYLAGDISRGDELSKILSIGYEFETSSLAKLTGILEKNKLVGFLNTDTAREDITILNNIKTEPSFFEKHAEALNMAQEDAIDIDSYENQKKIADLIKSYKEREGSYIKRMNEAKELRIKAYDSNEYEYPKDEVSFFTTNDISDSKIVKILNNVCQSELLMANINEVEKIIEDIDLIDMKDEIIDIIQSGENGSKILKKLEDLFKYDESSDSEYKEKIDNFYTALSVIYQQNDDYYKFQLIGPPHTKYNIHFEFWDPPTCGTFADVEWVITYYKPEPSDNIVLDTFINSLQNLSRHLDDYTGELVGNLKLGIKNPNLSDEVVESIIGNPQIRKIFYNPGRGQNYYLQTHVEYKTEEILGLDDCQITPQMTFSTLIQDAFTVMKYLIKDTIRNSEDLQPQFDIKYNLLENIEMCVEKLVEEYNDSDAPYKIISTRANKKGNKLIKGIKNYLGLILLKIYSYINYYLVKDPKDRTYLKDALTFNSRHKNIALYKEIKESMKILFKDKDLSNDVIVSIIQRLVVNEEVLTEYLLNGGNIFDDAFSIDKHIDRVDYDEGEEYGDPTVSILSYFQFFEEPIGEDNLLKDGTYNFYDWLEYKGVDTFSSQMDIQTHNGEKNKILIEFRGFAKMLVPYMLNIAEGDETILLKTLGSFKRLITLYEEKNNTETGGNKKNTKKKRRKYTLMKKTKSK